MWSPHWPWLIQLAVHLPVHQSFCSLPVILVHLSHISPKLTNMTLKKKAKISNMLSILIP